MSDEEQLSEEEIDEESVAEESVAAEPVAAEPAPESEAPADAEAEPELPSDEPKPEGEEEEEGGGDDAEETQSVAPSERRRSRATIVQEEIDPTTLTEAQQAMLANKKRQEQEAELKAMDADSRRKEELKNIEQELAELKRRQEERRKEREVEEREEEARRKEQAMKQKAEMEERRSKMEFEKMRRAEEKFKRAQAAGSFAGFGAEEDKGARNFVITSSGEKKEPEDKKKKGVMSAEQKQAAKANYMSIVNNPADTSNMMPNDIKAKIKQLHAKITRLESEKYDLEKRHERQDYDLKEMETKQMQRARNKAIAMGVNPDEEQNTNRPPKVNVASKHDRQVDRRTYKEKYDIFENPFIKPPSSIVRGSGKPPPEWGRSKNEKMDELETLRKNLEPFQYVEVAPVEGDEAKPPVDVIPLSIPTEEYDPSLAEKFKQMETKPFGTDYLAMNPELAQKFSEHLQSIESAPAPPPRRRSSAKAPTGGDTELEIVEEPVDDEPEAAEPEPVPEPEPVADEPEEEEEEEIDEESVAAEPEAVEA